MAKRWPLGTRSGLVCGALVLLAAVALTRSDDIETCIKDSNPGVCVYKFQCKDGFVVNYGEGIIDVRFSDVCGNSLMECCQVLEEPDSTTVEPSTNETSTDGGRASTTVAPPRPPIPTPKPFLPPYHQQSCGQRNPNGVIFQIENNVFSESEYGEFPWVVAIFRVTDDGPQFLCSGTLIDVAAVLTTVSCFQKYRGTGAKYMVRMGEWDLSNDREPIPAVEREVETLHLHPRYSTLSKMNDIAIAILSDSVQLSHTIGLACLADSQVRSNDIVGVGWGNAPNFVQPLKLPQTILKKSHLLVIDTPQCQRIMRKLITPKYSLADSFICAQGGAPNEEMLPCKGDSGSPYMVHIPSEQERYYVVGLSSWGFDCNVQDAPTVLTNVGYHREWIDKVISDEGLSPFSYTYYQEDDDQD